MNETSTRLQMMPVVGEAPGSDELFPLAAEPSVSIRCELEVDEALVDKHLPVGIDLDGPGRLKLEFRTVLASRRIGGRAFSALSVLVPARPAPGSVLEAFGDRGEYLLARWCSDPSTVLLEREVLGFPTQAAVLVQETLGSGRSRITLTEFATPLLTLEVDEPKGDVAPEVFSEEIQLLGWKWVTSAYRPGAADVDTLTSHRLVEEGTRSPLLNARLTLRDPGPDFAPVSSRIVAGLGELTSSGIRSSTRMVGHARIDPSSSSWTHRP